MRTYFNLLKIATLIMFMALLACDKDDDSTLENKKCDVSNPIEDLVWLKEAIDKVKQDEYSYYAMATYNGDVVFYYGNCNPVVNYISMVQNCKGDELGNTNDLMSELSDVTIIWKHETSECVFIH